MLLSPTISSSSVTTNEYPSPRNGVIQSPISNFQNGYSSSSWSTNDNLVNDLDDIDENDLLIFNNGVYQADAIPIQERNKRSKGMFYCNFV